MTTQITRLAKDQTQSNLDVAGCAAHERRTVAQRLGESGKIGYAILWLLGVPLPLLIIVYLIWGR